ncbi:arginine--tRNA ligase [Candidatus Mycoplasma haematobovis]|uniref:Arginine--tRNA ligase n=1 Tax=Candidatus Mycoplasma haematobovis TaxID=432608 RepID=A0A1A9QBN1_9MOLU|nr:arginine--tRNA ligase [Candidatus Mycoplasma haematobovis]OAL09877.1 arginine--tRNA ligase [Candidatus Mycoplasma haematobovis]
MPKINNYLIEEFKKALKALDYQEEENIFFEFPKNISFGDLSTNIACQISSKVKKAPKEIAEIIVKKLGKLKYIQEIRAEKNGFINLFFNTEAFKEYYAEVLSNKEHLYKKEPNNIWCFVEIVSANPTGLLHIGHARNGIFCDTLANLLEYGGYYVHREYLINDMGNQIKELISSVWNKYKAKIIGTYYSVENMNLKYDSPEIDECATYLISKHQNKWLQDNDIFKSKLYSELESEVIKYFLNEIEKDLNAYQIGVNVWKSERSFVNDSTIDDLLNSLREHINLKDGAVWFRAGDFLENCKDEVLVKKDGLHTYFCQDLIYHLHKLRMIGEKGKIINVLGADHYGHVDRLKSFLVFLEREEQVKFICMQLVKLIEHSTAVKISKRDSKIIYLRSLSEFMSYEEVRWFLISQHTDSPLEIELKKLKMQDYNNPAYYVLYAYSRISQLLRKHGVPKDYSENITFDTIKEGKEKELLNTLLAWEMTLNSAIETLSPHKIPQYLYKLAKEFHSYYEETQLLNKEKGTWLNDRLAILNAVQYTIKSGLSIMKITPKSVL